MNDKVRKGGKPPGLPKSGGGSRKGIPNKATREFRETITKLLDSNADNVGRWLTLVAEGDGTDTGKPDPAKALDLLSKLAEFAAPKLSRSEVTGKDGGPIAHEHTEKLPESVARALADLAGSAEEGSVTPPLPH